MIVYALVHDDDGLVAIHKTPEGAKDRIHTRPRDGWEWIEHLAWYRNGPYTIQRMDVE